MGILSLGWSLLMAAVLLVGVGAQRINRSDVTRSPGCPTGKGVCVQPQYCLEKRNTTKPSGLHQCFTEGKRKGVCCDRKKTTRNKDCTTSKRGPGRCVAEDQCHAGYTRDFLVQDGKNINKDSWWNQTSNICHQENRKNFYCCPTKLQKPVATLPPKKPVESWNDNAFSNCQLTKNVTGKCVPIRLCDEFHSRVMKRNPFYTYEKLAQHYKCASKNSDSTAVCCQNPKTPDGLIRHDKAKKLLPNNCGTVGMVNRVVAGSEADLGEFPWMANLMYYQKRIKTTLCSGSLIHAQYVLTAAHCSKPGATPISVRLGEHDLSKARDCAEGVCAKPFKEYAIAQWISHKNYDKTTKMHDIALVQLNKPAMIIKDQIIPICLPITEKWLMMKPSKLTVSGWGLTEDNVLPDVLMKATLESADESFCRKEQFICARGKNGEGHCKGDSGGPLQQTMRYGKLYRTVLFGVISGGAKKCSVEDPSAGRSISVAYHMKWILDNMKI